MCYLTGRLWTAHIIFRSTFILWKNHTNLHTKVYNGVMHKHFDHNRIVLDRYTWSLG